MVPEEEKSESVMDDNKTAKSPVDVLVQGKVEAPKKKKGTNMPNKTKKKQPYSSSSSSSVASKDSTSNDYFDSGKWEKRVSTNEKLRTEDKGDTKPSAAKKPKDKTTATVEPKAATAATAATRTTSVTWTENNQPPKLEEAAAVNTISPLPSAAAAATTTRPNASNTNNNNEILPGAFRMRPSVGAVSAREYDASDDFQQQQQESRRSVVDRSEDPNKEETTHRDAEGNDILVEATLVDDDVRSIHNTTNRNNNNNNNNHNNNNNNNNNNPARSSAAPSAPSAMANSALLSRPPDLEAPTTTMPFLPEPELVVAEPMKQFEEKQLQLQQEDASRRFYRWVIAGLLCCLTIFLIVAGIVLGVEWNKTKDNKDANDGVTNGQQTTAMGQTPTMAPTPFASAILPDYTQEALQDPNSPQSMALAWLENNHDYWQANQEEEEEAMDDDSYFSLQRFVLATFYYALQGDQWWEQDYWLEDNSDPCDYYTTFYGVICTVSQRRRYTRTRHLQGQVVVSQRRYYQRLSMFKNNLQGHLPPEIGLLSKLDVVDLHGNDISGTIPTQLGLWQDVTLLQLFNNTLSGTLPSELGQLPKIRQLNFAFNDISGVVPTVLGRLTTLEVFSVSNNDVTGGIPSELGLLTNLEGLHLYQNPLLGGTLPVELGSLRLVEEIQLHATNLQGPIPSSFGQLTQLTKLTLHNTSITGTVPQEVCALMQIGSLQVLTVDCDKVQCNSPCECGCTKSQTPSHVQTRETPAPDAGGSGGSELITDPPITVSGEVGRTPAEPRSPTDTPGDGTSVEDIVLLTRPDGHS